MSIILDATTKTIKVIMSGVAATTNPDFVAAWADNNGTTFAEGASDGALNGTTDVTAVAAPAASTRRIIKSLYIENRDTAAVTLTIKYDNNGTQRTIAKVTLQVGDTWSTDGTYDTNGSLKEVIGSVNLATQVSGVLPVANGGTNASTSSITSFNNITGFTASGATGTTSTNLVFSTTPTITTPVLTGLPTGSGVASAATASTLASRDANANLTTNNFISSYTTTATAAGTTTLTVSSTFLQFFTGSTTQTVTLPTTSIAIGQQYRIVNNSSGLVTVQSSGANTVVILGSTTVVILTALIATPTTAANWSFSYSGANTASGKVLTANNTITLAGTDATTMTFPTTTATIARTDAANTFTGVQTMTSPKIITQISDTNGNILVNIGATASAVNYVKVTNAITGTAGPILSADGETNVDLKVAGKGTGKIHRTTGVYGDITAYSPSAAGTATLTLNTANIHTVNMPAGNITIALSNEGVGQCFIINIVQDSVGSRTVTFFTTIKWAGGTAPTLTTTANKIDTVGFIVTSAGNYQGFVVGQNI